MLGFKKYIEERNRPIDQGVMVDGVPNYLILKGTHISQGVMVDGVPNAVINWDRRKRRHVEERTASEDWENENDNTHLGKSVGEIHKQLVSKDKTNDSDIPHIRKYTEESKHLNQTLFENHAKKVSTERHVSGHDTKALDTALKRNKLGHDLHVYSGTGFNPGEGAKKHPEGHIHLAAYTSTTIHKGIAKEFADSGDENMHVLHIHLKKGQKGKYIAHHSPGNSEEHEFLLPRNTTLKVHPKPSIHHDDYGSKYHIWHSEVVEGEPKK